MKDDEMTVKVIKIGNSYGARFSKKFMDINGIKPGDHVDFLVKPTKKSQSKALRALAEIAELSGPLTKIDVEQWQTDKRAKRQAKDDVFHDMLGH